MENLEEKTEVLDGAGESAKSQNNLELNDIKGNNITIEDAKATLTHNSDLIQGAINGESKAFNELYLQSYRYVFFVIRQYISDDETTYDAIQETFIKVYKNISKLREPSAYYGWLTSIAKNTAIDILRTKPSETELVYEDNNDRVMEDKQVEKDVSLDIKTVLKKLKPDEIDLLSLVYYDGMRISQIAKMQGVPATTVYSRFNKAKKNLKSQLKVHGIDKAIYSGSFTAMITTAIRNIIGTSLLSFAIAQQILNSVTGKSKRKELAIASIVKNHQKKMALKIASIIVALSMVTTIITFLLLKLLDKDIERDSHITQTTVETALGSAQVESNNTTNSEEIVIEDTIVSTNEKTDESSSTEKDTLQEIQDGNSNNEIVQASSSEGASDESGGENNQAPNVFGNTSNNVMRFYGDSFTAIGCPVAKGDDKIYYTDTKNIYEVNIDGSQKSQIYSSKTSKAVCYDLNLVGDCLYFVDDGIKRLNLDSKNVESVYDGDAFNLLVRGNTGWFVTLSELGGTAMLTQYSLYQIDLQSGETIALVNNAAGLGLKAVLENEIIYVNGDTVFRKSFTDGTEQQIYKILNADGAYYKGIENMCINDNYLYLLEKNFSYESRTTSIVKIDLTNPQNTKSYTEIDGYPIYDMYGCANGFGLLVAYNTSNGAENVFASFDLEKIEKAQVYEVFIFEDDDYIYTFNVDLGTIQKTLPDGSEYMIY